MQPQIAIHDLPTANKNGIEIPLDAVFLLVVEAAFGVRGNCYIKLGRIGSVGICA